MKRALVLVLLGVFSTTAFARAVKIKDFSNFADENSAEANADGMAILNYASGADKTEIQIILSGLAPDTIYEIKLISGSHAANPSNFEASNHQGNITLHLSLEELPDIIDPNDNGDWSDADVLVGFNIGTGTEVLILEGLNPNN